MSEKQKFFVKICDFCCTLLQLHELFLFLKRTISSNFAVIYLEFHFTQDFAVSDRIQILKWVMTSELQFCGADPTPKHINITRYKHTPILRFHHITLQVTSSEFHLNNLLRSLVVATINQWFPTLRPRQDKDHFLKNPPKEFIFQILQKLIWNGGNQGR